MNRFIRTQFFAVSAVALLAWATSVPAAAARSAGAIPDVTKAGHPNIKSAASLVVDLSTNEVLFEKDADLVRPIASISKIFGALVVLEDCKLPPEGLHEMTKVNREAARGGDKSKLTTGWSYTHRDLMHAALMRSDNRALPALAEACGLDPAAFAAKMTAKARALGLQKTSFKEPDGLSADNVSTAREIMVALRAVIKEPVLTEIMGKSEYTIVAHKGDRAREIKIKSTDRLLTKNLATILGGKTGYTDLARYCLAIAARTFSGREVGMVFLGAEGRYTRFADFTRVINWLDRSSAVASDGRKVPGQPQVQVIPTVLTKPGVVPTAAAVSVQAASSSPAAAAAATAVEAEKTKAGADPKAGEGKDKDDSGQKW